MVRCAFDAASGHDRPETVQSLRDRLLALARPDILPETQLLLALFPHVAAGVRKTASAAALEAARQALFRLRLGPAQHHCNLTLFPLFGENGGEPVCDLLQDAAASESAQVSEVDEAGSVPSLLVANRSARPLLIPEGDVLIGAKQERGVNITVIVAAGSKLVLPVSCVEHGRWSRVSANFAVAFSAPPALRRDKVRSAQRNREQGAEAQSDQGQVWNSVHAMLARSGVASPTQSMSDLFRARGSAVHEYKDRLSLPENARGFLAACGERVIGLDLYESPAALRKVWPRLSEGYFLEAIQEPEPRAETPAEKVQAFLALVGGELSVAEEPVGEGTELVLDGDSVSGSGVWFQGKLCPRELRQTCSGNGLNLSGVCIESCCRLSVPLSP